MAGREFPGKSDSGKAGTNNHDPFLKLLQVGNIHGVCDFINHRFGVQDLNKAILEAPHKGRKGSNNKVLKYFYCAIMTLTSGSWATTLALVPHSHGAAKAIGSICH